MTESAFYPAALALAAGMTAQAVAARAAKALVHVPLELREASLTDGPRATPPPAASVPSPFVEAW